MREESNRTQWLHLRLKPEEYSRIQEKFKKTTCRKLSEYARKVLLDKPLTVTYRNLSLDDFMQEMVRLRTDLNAIGNNLNQAVKRLHSLNQIAELRIWLATWSNTTDRIDEGIKEIKSRINNLPKEWLR